MATDHEKADTIRRINRMAKDVATGLATKTGDELDPKASIYDGGRISLRYSPQGRFHHRRRQRTPGADASVYIQRRQVRKAACLSPRPVATGAGIAPQEGSGDAGKAMSGWEKSINGIGRDRAGPETRRSPVAAIRVPHQRRQAGQIYPR